jgi:hypothetical protein
MNVEVIYIDLVRKNGISNVAAIDIPVSWRYFGSYSVAT